MNIAKLILLWILSISPGLASASTTSELDLLANMDKSQREAMASTVSDTSSSPRDKMAHEYQMQKETNKVYEVIALCALALASLFVVLHFLSKNKDNNTGAYIVNATGLIFIIVGTISLTIMAQTEQQLTAAIGIMGAIAGYLFGTMKSKEPANEGEATADQSPRQES